MAHKNDFVVSVRVDGKIARETRESGEDRIHIPFGSDYSLILKNLNSRKASVKISIDGKDAGADFLVDPNSESEIKGFFDSGTNSAKNAFRFIRKTKDISDYRGDRIDDGLIRVEVTYEVPRPEPLNTPRIKIDPWKFPDPWKVPNDRFYGALKSSSHEKGIMRNCSLVDRSPIQQAQCLNMVQPPSEIPESGITVPGRVVNQGFREAYIGRLESNSTVFVFRLVGAIEDKPVIKPLLVSSMLRCQTCGKTWNSSMQFCGSCGTNLRP